MALSRTARILLAILLLAAAAFFWVNFFTQERPFAEEPDLPPTAVTPDPTTAPDPAVAEDAPAVGDDPTVVEVEPPVDPDAPPEAVDPDAPPPEAVDPDAPPPEAVDPDAPPVVVEPDAPPPDVVDPDVQPPVVAEPPVDPAVDPPVVVIDPPITVTRDVEVADLPFLITEPPVAPELEDLTAVAALEAERALAAARATVNPFSPIMVRRAPEREVPADPTITEVAVPDGPPAPPPRVSAPAPRPLAPAPSVEAPRALPTGTPLAAAPRLLQEPRAIDTIDRPSVPTITTARLPEEPGVAPPVDSVRTTPGIVTDLPDLRGTGASVLADEPRVGEAPLAAGTNRLARYLRDNGYRFTGSVLGPVSVGVFRSNAEPAPQVVALGQTLPNTDIVLTNLRGEQAELTLDDISQILMLDLRR